MCGGGEVVMQREGGGCGEGEGEGHCMVGWRRGRGSKIGDCKLGSGGPKRTWL